MTAPATDTSTTQIREFRDSVLSANALSLDIMDPAEEKIDNEIKQNLEKRESLAEVMIEREQIVTAVVIEEPEPVNEDELTDQNGEFIIFEKEEPVLKKMDDGP